MLKIMQISNCTCNKQLGKKWSSKEESWKFCFVFFCGGMGIDGGQGKSWI